MTSIARWQRVAAVLPVAAVALAAALALTAPTIASAAVASATTSQEAGQARAKASPPTPGQELASIAAAHKKSAPPALVLAPGPLVWEAPAGIDSDSIESLACPSIALCVAVDNHGNAVTSLDPAAGAGSWHSLDIDGGSFLAAVSCPSVSICVAVDGSGKVVSTSDASSPAPGWTVAQVDTSITEPSPYGGGSDLLRGLSCPSVSFCIAADSVGNVVFSGAPTAGTGAWVLAHVDDNSDYGCAGGGPTCQAPLMGVSCPSVSVCAAVDYTGNVLETNTPAGAAVWPSQKPFGSGRPVSLWTVSCPTASFCATVDGVGGHVITWNPAAGAHLTVHRLPIDAFGIWCRSSALCLASGESPDGTAELVGSTNPAASSPAWDMTDFGDFNAAACPTSSMCVAVDNQGQMVLGVTVASLKAALLDQALGGRIPKIGGLVRRRGYTLSFTSPLAGQLKIDWELTGAAAKAAGGSSTAPLVLATGSAGFTGAQKRTVALALTGAGRKVLKGAKRLTLTAAATYATNTGTVAAQRRLALAAR